MTDDVRERLDALYGRSPDSIWDSGDAMTDAILADESLLVVARPKCPYWERDGHHPGDLSLPCPECGGTSYLPITVLPTKVAEEWAAVVRTSLASRDALSDVVAPTEEWAARMAATASAKWSALDALSAEAVRLAQETDR